MVVQLNGFLIDSAKKVQDQQHLKVQFDALHEKWDEQNHSFLELQTQYAVLSEKFRLLEADLKETQEQNKTLAHEKWILRQEKSQLYGQLKQLETQFN